MENHLLKWLHDCLPLSVKRVKFFLFYSFLSLLSSIVTPSIVKAQNQIPDREQEWTSTAAMMSWVAYQGEKHYDYDTKLHDAGWHWGTSEKEPSGLNYVEFQRVVNNKKEIVIAFAGTELHNGIEQKNKDLYTDASQLIIPPQQYRDALLVADSYIKEKDKDKNMILIFAGHSKGGGLAQLVSLTYGTKSYVFNSAGLGDVTINFTNSPRLGVLLRVAVDGIPLRLTDLYLSRPQKENMASSVIMNFRDAGDWVSSAGHQYGNKYILSSQKNIPQSDQFGEFGHHSMTNMIEEITSRAGTRNSGTHPAPLGGVDMKMKIDSKAFKHNSALKKILKN